MDGQNLYDIIVGGVLSVLGLFLKDTYSTVKKTSDDLSLFKEHVAREYPTNNNIDRRFDKMEKMLERFGEKLDKVLEK